MTSQRRYRVGLAGYGGRARQLGQAWLGVPEAQLVAVADLKPELRDKVRAELPDVAVYESHLDMLNHADLDIVTIGTTGYFHAAITRDTVAKGVRGIYCEKPMACSLSDADQMVEDCRAGGAVFVMGHQRRYNPSIIRLRDALRNGEIGRPAHGYMYWASGRVGSNGTHFFDALNFILDSHPVEVVGRVGRGLDLTKVDDHPVYNTRLVDDPGAMGFITYANGFRLALDCMNDVLLPYTYLFCGTKGRISVDEIGFEVDYRARDENTRSHRDAWKPVPRREFSGTGPWVGYEAEQNAYRDLMRCIETGERPVSSAEDGRSVIETITAFHLSSDAGMKPIALPLPPEERGYPLKVH